MVVYARSICGKDSIGIGDIYNSFVYEFKPDSQLKYALGGCVLILLVPSFQGQRTHSVVKENNLCVAAMAVCFLNVSADREFLSGVCGQ